MKQLVFGTDGIRTKFGTEPLTPELLVRLGRSIGQWAINNSKLHIAIAHDSRASGDLIKASLQTGLLQFPVIVTDCKVIPTPLLAHLVDHSEFDCGIMITASHNPASDNGIKILLKEQGKLSESDEKEVINLFSKDTGHYNPANLGTLKEFVQTDTWYINHLMPFFAPEFLAKKRIVLDCAHGAVSKIAPLVFAHYKAEVITLHANPNGHNINQNCGSVHPEILQKTVVETNADFGCAFDGDGDRLCIVSRDGIVKDGDDILALLSNHPTYTEQSIIVGTVMSNQGIVQHCITANKKFVRTPVGDKYVAKELKNNNALLGGEPSGHTILRDFSETSDAIFTALKVLETALLTNNDRCISFVKFPQVIINIPAGQKKDLNDPSTSEFIKSKEAQLQQGRILVRYSGTEPLLRIMIECSDASVAQSVATELSNYFKNYLQ